MFENFNFSLLDDPDFKEDSVREELVVPLLRALGYSAGGPARIVRSKSLDHPFVSIGSKRHAVKIIPDYLLHASEKHRWILDAKAPSENITKGSNTEQAFSYSIHPEIRASRYALCNGRQISIFDIDKFEPLLLIDLKDLTDRFTEIEQLLSPLAFTRPYLFNFKPDIGLYMWKSGYSSEKLISYIPMGVPCIAKVQDGLYSINVNIKHEEEWFAAVFDFDDARLEQLYSVLSTERAEEVRDALKNRPFEIVFEDDIPVVCMEVRLSEQTYSNENEDYCPLNVENFSRY